MLLSELDDHLYDNLQRNFFIKLMHEYILCASVCVCVRTRICVCVRTRICVCVHTHVCMIYCGVYTVMDDAVLSSPEPISEIPEEYVPLPPKRPKSPDRPHSLILKKRGITLDPLIINNGKHSIHPGLSPKTPGILKKAVKTYSNLSSPSKKQHNVTFDPDKIKGSSETVDSSIPYHRKASLSMALRSPMVYVQSSFNRFNRPSEGSWRTRESSTQVVNSSNFISFHNVSYTLAERRILRNSPPKAIINNVRFVSKLTCYILLVT